MTDSSPVQISSQEPSPFTTARRKLASQLAMDPTAFSVDGRTFAYEAPLAWAMPAGDFVEIRTGEATYLGQVLDATVTEREGPEFTLQGDAGLNIGTESLQVSQTSVRMRLRNVVGNGTLLARTDQADIALPTSTDKFNEAAIAPAEVDTVSAYLAASGRKGTQLPIGRLAGIAGNAPEVTLQASGFGRHTFLVGQSGSGKTYSLGVMLEQLLLETNLRIVIVDPNSDYVRLGDVRQQSDPDLQGHAERYRHSAAKIRVLRPAGRASDPANELKLRFSDLSPQVQGLVLKIDPIADREEYEALWSIIRHMGTDRYSLKDVQEAASRSLSAENRQVALRIANLGIADWTIWAEADQHSLADLSGDWRGLILDVGGLARAEEKSLVANALFGNLWHHKDERIPTLIVVDEAHNICPQEPEEPIQAMATQRAITIAAEGRKYGLYLLLSTQRPSKIHINVLSQCDNLVLMRMNSSEDVRHLAEVFSFVPPTLMERSTTFAQGESLIAGKITPIPLLARFGHRYSHEGGSDIPDTWTRNS